MTVLAERPKTTRVVLDDVLPLSPLPPLPPLPTAALSAPLPTLPSLDLSAYPEFPNRKRFTRTDCELLERVGALEGRVELLDGIIIDKMGQNRFHAVTMVLLMKWLTATFGADYVQCQLPIEVSEGDQTRNQPEPDASVLTQPATDFLEDTPGPGDLRLVVEVSDTTLRDDLLRKSVLYARAGIPEYWILDVQSRRLFVYCDAENGLYQSVIVYAETDTVTPQSAPDNAVLVAALFPPVKTDEA